MGLPEQRRGGEREESHPSDNFFLGTHKSSRSSSNMSAKASVAKSSATVIGGKLKFKGSKSSSSSSSTKPKQLITTTKPVTSSAASSLDAQPNSSSSSSSSNNHKKTADSEYLTEAQRRHRDKKLELESRTDKKLTTTTYRDRVEMFNAKLGRMTEHNDIPRVSAAGNG